MEIETLQLIMEAGPNAVEAMKYYFLAGISESVITGMVIFGVFGYITHTICKTIKDDTLWDSLSHSQQSEVAVKRFSKEK